MVYEWTKTNFSIFVGVILFKAHLYGQGLTEVSANKVKKMLINDLGYIIWLISCLIFCGDDAVHFKVFVSDFIISDKVD